MSRLIVEQMEGCGSIEGKYSNQQDFLQQFDTNLRPPFAC